MGISISLDGLKVTVPQIDAVNLRLDGIEERIARLETTMQQVLTGQQKLAEQQKQEMQQMAVDQKTFLTALTASVAKTTDAEQSAIETLTTLAGQIREAAQAQDFTSSMALADQLNSNAQALAAAIVANTAAASGGGTATGGATDTSGGTTGP